MNGWPFAGTAALLLCLAGCAAPPPRFADSDYPGLLQPPHVLGRDVLWQQRVTATWGEGRARGFDAAVQTQGDTLTLIGLSPLGSTAFAVQWRNGRIELHNETGEELPFPPRFILLDVERVFYPWLAHDGQTLADGEHAGVVGDERVVEVVAGGRVVARRFTRVDGRPPGTIAIRCEWGRADWQAPSRAVLDNGWFGYRLTIDTLAETILPPAADAAGSR